MLINLFRFCLDAKSDFNKLVKQFDLTFSQWQVLKVINTSTDKELTMNQVVERLNSDKATVSMIVKKLKEKEMLQTRSDSEDKRCTYLSLTTKMTNRCQELKSIEEEFTNNLFSNLNDEEKRVFKNLIEKL